MSHVCNHTPVEGSESWPAQTEGSNRGHWAGQTCESAEDSGVSAVSVQQAQAQEADSSHRDENGCDKENIPKK